MKYLIGIGILTLLCIIIRFFVLWYDNWEIKKRKRWSNACRSERDDYRKLYGYSPPGWEWEK